MRVAMLTKKIAHIDHVYLQFLLLARYTFLTYKHENNNNNNRNDRTHRQTRGQDRIRRNKMVSIHIMIFKKTENGQLDWR